MDELIKEIRVIVDHYARPMNLQEVTDLLCGRYEKVDIVAAVWAGFDQGDLIMTPDRLVSTENVRRLNMEVVND
jgi:hypothetical protein